jgi:hypothetical protein
MVSTPALAAGGPERSASALFFFGRRGTGPGISRLISSLVDAFWPFHWYRYG